MTYFFKKIINTLKKLPDYQILHVASNYLVVGTQITIQGTIDLGGKQKYRFQPYTFLDIADASVTVGTKITLEDAVDCETDDEYEDKYCFQLDISTKQRTLPVYFNIVTQNEITAPNKAPYFIIAKKDDLESQLQFFIKKTFLTYAP